MGIEYNLPRLHTSTETAESAIQRLGKLIIANLEDKIGLTESINLRLRVKRLSLHSGPKVSPFELFHCRKPQIDLTNN